ncbi:MAG TPA: extracellular solute-binding protein [Chloroflexota bacterium]|nr:extracellular solute-binding protein [Chloroflexota bacterium]
MSLRPWFLAFAVLLLLAGCGGSAAPAASPSGGSEWDALVAAAKQEGKVVVKGPPTAAVRTDVAAAFKKQFGIDMEYTGGQSGDAATQLAAERKAGEYSTDAILAGADTMYGQIYGQKMLDPIPPALVLPDAKDASKWPDGKLWFMDPDGQYVLRLNNSVTNSLQINTDIIKPGTITSWADLLKPEYVGKIASFDPTVSGAGLSDASYLAKQFGMDFLKKLFIGQKVTFSRDHRELADWLARGKYPIVISLREVEFHKIVEDKFPVAYVLNPTDASGYVSAGFGLLGLMNHAPHPNAAKVFVNWIASKDGMDAWSRAEGIVPVRSDVDKSPYWKEQIPEAGRSYFDSFGWDWVLTERKQTMQQLQQLLRS